MFGTAYFAHTHVHIKSGCPANVKLQIQLKNNGKVWFPTNSYDELFQRTTGAPRKIYVKVITLLTMVI